MPSPSELSGFFLNADAGTAAPPKVAFTRVFDYDGSGNLLYEGWARSSLAPQTSQAVWALRKFTYAGGYLSGVSWPSGVATETFIWDNRAGLTYQ